MLHVLRAVTSLLLVAFVMPAVAWVAGCSSPPKPKSNPMYPDSAALGVKLKMRKPVRFLSAKPAIVIFARVEEGVELTDSYEIYGSTYAHDGRAYLMNVEPGTYVMVAAIYETMTQEAVDSDGDDDGVNIERTINTCINYPSRELIELSRVNVRPGEFGFMGSIVADQSMWFGDGDECQRHFMDLVEGDESGWVKSQSGGRSLRLSLHEMDAGPVARKEFLANTREDFTETGWVALIDSAIAKAP
jgi:hypothetical protein